MNRPPRLRRAAPTKARAATLTALWGVILLLVGGISAVGYAYLHRPPDTFALCQAGGPLAASTVILADVTDPLTAMQQRRLKAAADSERDRLRRGGRLTVLAINTDRSEEPVELVSVCNPGSPAEADPLFETVSKAERRYADLFSGPIEAAIAAAVATPPADASPIIETVAAILTRPDFDGRVRERRLLIVSDLLQHSKGGYSQLKGGDFLRDYQAAGLAARAPLDLGGVTVAIDYLVRAGFSGVQGDPHRLFWEKLFADAGAVGVSFIGMRPPVEASPARAEENAAAGVTPAIKEPGPAKTKSRPARNKKKRRSS